MKRLVLVHTVAPLVDTFTRLAKELLPGTQVYHILDELMLEQVRQQAAAGLDRPGSRKVHGVLDRLSEHIEAAEEIGAEAVLVTCSTVSPLVDQVRAGIPVLKIDEAMIAQAVERGRRIMVLATNPTTLEPTRQALAARAEETGKTVDLRVTLVEGAFAAYLGRDMAAHDRLVAEAIRAAVPDVDLIVLAQASMTRVLAVVPEQERRVPVLTSPHTALERLRGVI